MGDGRIFQFHVFINYKSRNAAVGGGAATNTGKAGTNTGKMLYIFFLNMEIPFPKIECYDDTDINKPVG
jgi:hypothetical protein